jgi:predicted XRE-type DNA-binding protein
MVSEDAKILEVRKKYDRQLQRIHDRKEIVVKAESEISQDKDIISKQRLNIVEKVNNLINGILKEFTIENLLSYLIKLGQNVEIMVTNQQEDKSQPKINVVYQKIA